MVEYFNFAGYSYILNGRERSFCNPYACCKFLNEYIAQQRIGEIDLSELLQSNLNINTLVSNVKRHFEKGKIADIVKINNNKNFI